MPKPNFWEAFYWRKSSDQGAKDRGRAQNSLWNGLHVKQPRLLQKSWVNCYIHLERNNWWERVTIQIQVKMQVSNNDEMDNLRYWLSNLHFQEHLNNRQNKKAKLINGHNKHENMKTYFSNLTLFSSGDSQWIKWTN